MKQEYKILLETMTGCPGSCTGCLMSSAERKDGGFWNKNIQDASINWLNNYINKINDNESITFIFAQGDHFSLSNETLKSIPEFGFKAGLGKATGMISAAAIGKTEDIKNKAIILKESSILNNFPIGITLVLDFKKAFHNKFSPIYSNNINAIVDVFGILDLAINIGPDICETISAKEVNNFIMNHGFKHITINLLPTTLNSFQFKQNWIKILNWIENLHNEWKTNESYELAFEFRFSALHKSYGNFEYKEFMKIFNKRTLRNLIINHNGNISTVFEGLGDGFSLNERFNLKSPTNVFENINESLKKIPVNSQRIIMKKTKDKRCQNCEMLNTCIASGTFLLNDIMKSKNTETKDCPSGIKDILMKTSKGEGISHFDDNCLIEEISHNNYKKLMSNYNKVEFENEFV